MGVVWRARDTKLDRDVALKVLPEPFASSPLALSRFEAEAKAVAALSHPGIVSIHDFGRIDGTTFAVTELLEGESLRGLLDRGPLPLSRALDVAAQVADALAGAHEQGLVHRDLKPENVFLLRDGRAKLLDFGIAVRCGPIGSGEGEAETPTDPVLSAAGGTPGTAAYMSPEHARGLAVGPASDQFSLGVVLYEMLAGSRPFRGASPAEVLSSILRDEPPPLSAKVPGLPDPVRWIADRCLRKRPEERYASTRDLARDLSDCRDRLREGTLPAARGAARRPHGLVVAGGAALAVALAFFGARWAETGREAAEFRRALAGRTVRRLTERSASAGQPALAPDGRTVAFVRRLSPSNTDVFVQSVGGARPICITADHAGEDAEPAFSPDGTQLAFWSDREGGGLFTVETLGGPPSRATTFGHDPAWFPDGRRLVFATTAAALPYSRLGSRSQLFTIDLATGMTSLLYEGDALQPAVSPRGLRVAFWALREGGSRRDIATISTEPGSQVTAPVFVTDDEAVDVSPFFTDDGYLWFASDRGGTMNLWRVRIDERSGRPLEPPEPFPVPARSSGPFRGTPDGRAIAYQAGTSSFDLDRVPLDARGLPSGPPEHLVSDANGIGEPHVSPGGGLVAFSSRLAEEDLWVVGTDGRGLRRVTTGPYRDRSPSFSADGRTLYFHSNRSGKFEIWSIHLDGTGLSQLTQRDPLQPFRALVSPDGRLLSMQDTRAGAILVPLGLRRDAPWPSPLPRPESDVRFEVTSFSADGRLAAGHGIGLDETYRGVWLRDLAAGRYEKLAEGGAAPQLVAGGRRVYFLRQRSLFAPAPVALLDRETGRTHEVAVPLEGPPVVAFCAAPDGSALYLVRERSASDVWLMRIP